MKSMTVKELREMLNRPEFTDDIELTVIDYESGKTLGKVKSVSIIENAIIVYYKYCYRILENSI